VLSPRQKEIVDATIKIIAQKGIQKFTIKNLAIMIGISEAALYRHFRSKHDIMLAVLEKFREFSNFQLRENSTGLTSLEEVRAFLFDRYRKFTENPDMAVVLFGEENFQYDAELSQKLLSIMNTHGEVIKKMIKKGQEKHQIRDDISPQSMFRIIVGSMRLLVNQWCLSRFRFDLLDEGDKLWQNLKKLLI